MGREIIQARGGVFELAIQKEERKETVERLKQPLKYVFVLGQTISSRENLLSPRDKKRKLAVETQKQPLK